MWFTSSDFNFLPAAVVESQNKKKKDEKVREKDVERKVVHVRYLMEKYAAKWKSKVTQGEGGFRWETVGNNNIDWSISLHLVLTSLLFDLDCCLTFTCLTFTALWPSLYLDLHCFFTFTVLWPSLFLDIHCSLTFTALWPSPLFDLHCSLTFTVLRPSLLFDLHLCLTFTALWPSLFLDLHCSLTFTALWPSPLFNLHCSLTFTSVWPSLAESQSLSISSCCSVLTNSWLFIYLTNETGWPLKPKWYWLFLIWGVLFLAYLVPISECYIALMVLMHHKLNCY